MRDLRLIARTALALGLAGCGGGADCMTPQRFTSPEEVEPFTACTEMAGINLRPEYTGPFSLPLLERTTQGFLAQDGLGVREIDLPAVVEIGGPVRIDGNTRLERVTLTSLTTTRGEVSIDGNPRLSTLELPALVSVLGPATVSGNHMLPDCQAEAAVRGVAAAGGLTMTDDNLGDGCP